MSCGGVECPAWCECRDERCVPSEVNLNAVRFRMRDGRYLAAPGGAGWLTAGGTADPGPFGTFYVTPAPTFAETWVFNVCNDGWAPSGNVIRIAPRFVPHPDINGNRWGGPGCDVSVISYPLSVPGWRGAEQEYTARMIKADGSDGEPTSGDEILLVAAEGTYFRVRGPGEERPGTVVADGTAAAADTTFQLVRNEVRPGDGWRPAKVVCVNCAPVTGVVRNYGTGEPVPGAHVVADGTSFEATTDAQGRFTLTSSTGTCVPAGTHTLNTTHPTHLPDERQITVEPEVPLDLVIDLHLNCAPVTGLVQDYGSGNPLGSAHVVAEGTGFTATTDEDQGRFALVLDGSGCVVPGTHTLITTHDTHVPDRRQIDVQAEVPIDLAIDLVCTPVSGVVLDAGSTPVPNVVVFLLDADGHKVRRPDGQTYIQTTTGADGTWTLWCVPHGDTGRQWFFWTAGANKVSAFVPPAGQAGVNIRVGSVEVRGTVTVAETAAPVEDATVTLTGTAVPSTTTDTVGSYRFSTAQPDTTGQVTVSAAHVGYLDAERTVPAQVPTTIVDLQLIPVVPIQVEPVVLTLEWGDHPADLDAHLSGPDTNNGRFHLFYANRQTAPVDYASLNVDDQDAHGPENITISPTATDFIPGQYRYWVHNYSGLTFAGSAATVTVRQGSNQLDQYTVAAATGSQDERIWHVVNVKITATGAVQLIPVQRMRGGDANTRL